MSRLKKSKCTKDLKGKETVLYRPPWEANRRQRTHGRILRGVEDCAKLVDVATQHSPEVSSLVWAGSRFILMVGYISGFYNIKYGVSTWFGAEGVYISCHF